MSSERAVNGSGQSDTVDAVTEEVVTVVDGLDATVHATGNADLMVQTGGAAGTLTTTNGLFIQNGDHRTFECRGITTIYLLATAGTASWRVDQSQGVS